MFAGNRWRRLALALSLALVTAANGTSAVGKRLLFLRSLVFAFQF